MSLTLSIVVPTLNEEKRITQTLSHLKKMDGISEIIVSDGGSQDSTAKLVQSFGGIKFVQGQKGRARQMNLGASLATGDVILFLHADVTLPTNAAELIKNAFVQENVVAGAFKTWTIDDTETSFLGPFLHLADFRSRYTKYPYGDQAIFVRKNVFHAVGAYPDQELMEDLELCRKMWKHGKIVRLPHSVFVSGRRMLSRPIFFLIAINVFPFLYQLGVKPKTLARLYGNPR